MFLLYISLLVETNVEVVRDTERRRRRRVAPRRKSEKEMKREEL